RIKRVEIGKHHVSLDASWIADSHMRRVCEHGVHLVANLVRRSRERDRVPKRLAGFATVHARQARRGREQRAALRYDLVPGETREAAHDFVGLFNHRKLILAHRNQRRPKRSDVRRLTYWIRKESRRDVPIKATQLDLATHGRIA